MSTLLYCGFLPEKMTVALDSNAVSYEIAPNTDGNSLVGKLLRFEFSEQTACVGCGAANVELDDGFCAHCDATRADRDICKLKPELCHKDSAENPCRDPEWANTNCAEQVIYLSNTADLKVGITRIKNLLSGSRWIDQGASQAIALFTVPSRLQAGLVEVAIAEFVKDKTNWRTMLTSDPAHIDMKNAACEIKSQVKDALALYGDILNEVNHEPRTLCYPVSRYPSKIGNPLNSTKTPAFTAELIGIKGQYLLLGNVNGEGKDAVLSMRKHAGRHLTLTIER